MKKSYLIVFALLLFTLFGCTNNNDDVEPVISEPVETVIIEEGLPEMTLAELALYDGTNGAKAYVAINGMIYDVTDSEYWPNGSHNGFQAGQDLTIPLTTQAPHSIANIERFPVVGTLVSGA